MRLDTTGDYLLDEDVLLSKSDGSESLPLTKLHTLLVSVGLDHTHSNSAHNHNVSCFN